MNDFTFPAFFKNYSTYTALYSQDVCIDVYCSTDRKMAIVTMIEFKTLNTTDRITEATPCTEADFLERYKQAQQLIKSALSANQAIEQLA